ncbi:MAG: FAD-dependent oxidoreductase [Candidatus Promineifilaceae bacterium]
MQQVGLSERPLRVAIVGAGPAGFYVAENLFKQKDLVVQVDMFDRLPTPFGLVRNGVAPDHQKIKSVVKVFDKLASSPNFRFFGYIEVGKDVSVEELRRHYHQIVYSTGAQTDRALNIPGMNLAGSHAATEFVAWYNGHPDYRDCVFDLSAESAAIIGVGNVAVDVARILCHRPEELAVTDIADYALEALRRSRVREVHMIGRRGPAQAAFTPVELKELAELPDTDVIVYSQEAELDPLSSAALADADRGTQRNVEIVQSIADLKPAGKRKRLYLRFLLSPTELLGNAAGELVGVKLARNELYATGAGSLRSRPTGEVEELAVGLIFRSIGYRGVPLPGVPFNDDWGVILNRQGRVLDPETQRPLAGEYAAGWIKRGPSGVIGTNKPDAAETVEQMVADWRAGEILRPEAPAPRAVKELIVARQPDYFSYADWQRLDEFETGRGQAQGRPRVKLTSVEEMLAARER